MTGDQEESDLIACWFPQDPFYLDCDVDAVADHDSAALEGNVERHAEVAAFERSRRGESGSLVAVWVGAEPVDLDSQRNLPVTPCAVSSPSRMNCSPSSRNPVDRYVICGYLVDLEEVL